MSSFGVAILRPGAHLMRRLRMPTKMALMGQMLLVPLLVLIAYSALQAQAELRFTRSELAGAKVVDRLTAVTTLLQTHRGLTSRAQASDAAAVTERDALRVQLRNAVAAVDATAKDGLPFDLADGSIAEAAARLKLRHVLSIDAGFDVYRDRNGKPLINLLRG